MIEARGLCKQFGRRMVLNALSLTIPEGEIFAFLGPNGAGKTTTIRIFTGLLKPGAGQALVNGRDVAREPLAIKQEIGYLPDQPYVYPKLKGIEYLHFLADIYRIDWRAAVREIERLALLFDLRQQLDELVETYSHGMKQKLVLTGIFFRRPRVVFMDEPMVGLDPKSARALKTLVIESARTGMTFFISTHTLEIAQKLCGRIGIIKEGTLIVLEDTDALLRRTAAAGDLEEVFLELTGSSEAQELL